MEANPSSTHQSPDLKHLVTTQLSTEIIQRLTRTTHFSQRQNSCHMSHLYDELLAKGISVCTNIPCISLRTRISLSCPIFFLLVWHILVVLLPNFSPVFMFCDAIWLTYTALGVCSTTNNASSRKPFFRQNCPHAPFATRLCMRVIARRQQ